MDVGARRQRLEQSPLGAGEVLEAVREDGVVAPCVEVPGQPLDRRVAAACPRSHASSRVELRAVRPGQRGQRLVQVVGLEETPVELGERATDRLRVSRETRAALPARRRTAVAAAGSARRPRAAGGLRRRRRREPRRSCRRSRWSPPGDHRTVRPAPAPPVRRRSGSGRSARDPARSRRRTGREAARPSRHAPDRRRGRAPPAHGSRVVLPLRLTSSPVRTRKSHRARKRTTEGGLRLKPEREPNSPRNRTSQNEQGSGSSRSPAVAQNRRQARDFGLRPRRATAAPGIPPAHESHRSAAFAPRRASLNVTRMTAPFPSSTSVPQLSQTSTVFRATIPSRCGNRSAISTR